MEAVWLDGCARSAEAQGVGGRHGKYTSFSHFLMEAPKELYVHLWQKARVGRYLALVAYCTLNFASLSRRT